MLAQRMLETRCELDIPLGQRHAVNMRHFMVAQQHDHRFRPQPVAQGYHVEDDAQAPVTRWGAIGVYQVAQEDQTLRFTGGVQFMEARDIAFERIAVAM